MTSPAYHTCLNARLRRATRAIGRHYDAALKPSGLKSTQFTVLAVFAYHAELSMTKLAEVLGMDRTTLTRNLQPLIRAGWLEQTGEKDARVRMVRMTEAGQMKLEEATPFWEEAQRRAAAPLATHQRADLMDALARIAD